MVVIKSVHSGFNQQDQIPYIQIWNQIQQYSHQEHLPQDLLSSCKNFNSTKINSLKFPVAYMNGTFTATSFQKSCGTSRLCILTEGSSLIINDNLNVAAMKVLGTVYWNETTQLQPFQWLCAGYIVIEHNGVFKLSLNSNSKKALIYLKNNGAIHPSLRTRVFGGYNTNTTINGPTIDVSGQPMARTWSLLYKTVPIGSNKIQLIHNPNDMGWKVGDRIVIAPTTRGSSGYAESYYIKAINSVDNGIILDTNITKQIFNANILHNGTSSSIAIMSAEVKHINNTILYLFLF